MFQAMCWLTVDRAFELLSSTQRRRILRYLVERAETTVDREELVRVLHSHEDVDFETLETILAHHHLPMLEDAGVIEYDHRSGVIRKIEVLHELDPLLDACEELEQLRE